ncbi:MAG: sigma-70 family RNA polymerase sigma factor [Brevundimonas sp.]|uniref:sigma-70 family RNA polymerase sigma factor n=1 Tax=Brevundimonas sp. TaxID=1871086 RepID=UPI002ABA437F|nr:sigma-70 family RNA polymerase sigma factor [Brevundimonas sp.]MDZ4111100.1 sigma-70 family RNA polymerase sigma factor [Brevundimonas sp.]
MVSDIGLARAGAVSGEAEYDRLIQAVARDRDREAFAALFDHFAPRLKAYLMRAGAAPAAADDFAQDAMLTVWRKAEQFDPGRARAATWIFTIARNRRIDALRRENRPLPVPEITLASSDPERPDELLEARQDEGRVRAALRSLKPDQIEVIQMAFFQDLTHAEVAQSLALPLGTVKSRIRNAMIKLRDLLDQPVGEQS